MSQHRTGTRPKIAKTWIRCSPSKFPFETSNPRIQSPWQKNTSAKAKLQGEKWSRRFWPGPWHKPRRKAPTQKDFNSERRISARCLASSRSARALLRRVWRICFRATDLVSMFGIFGAKGFYLKVKGKPKGNRIFWLLPLLVGEGRPK